ncbi:ferritin-like domain-containing protein [Maricaulis sp.]|uniref:ferritin-like domain-containing protein n=1 Tax=Maricaulis sp. TaxID=1486257 RepID=UPI001B1E2D85|nr:ferritin-like domain-containing protein [Maricaulis sp.]MBO6766193.1 ferritin-like domain-containing protein [Maricaulis sp.]
MSDETLLRLALRVLETAEPRAKAAAAREAARAWTGGVVPLGEPVEAPERPARPAEPVCVAPGKVPRRRLNTLAGRCALMHAIAHIEFNAIDLAFDMVVRFAHDSALDDARRPEFVTDWVGVGDDEARHFEMVADRLEAMGSHYGALPAHDGLWDSAQTTAGALDARLAVAPMVLEARGLDVTPGMIERLMSAGDRESAEILRIIYEEEVGHVAAGARWFRYLCEKSGHEPASHFQTLVTKYFRGRLKPPFNTDARKRADLPADFYGPLV